VDSAAGPGSMTGRNSPAAARSRGRGAIARLATGVALAAGTTGVWLAEAQTWWWATVIVGFAAGIVIPGKRPSWLVGTGSGLLGWALPLAFLATKISLPRAAIVLAALMGYGPPALPIGLTVILGTGLGACGTWVGRALRQCSDPVRRVVRRADRAAGRPAAADAATGQDRLGAVNGAHPTPPRQP